MTVHKTPRAVKRRRWGRRPNSRHLLSAARGDGGDDGDTLGNSAAMSVTSRVIESLFVIPITLSPGR